MIVAAQLYPILSPLVGGAMYPMVAPERVKAKPPYITWQVISTQPENTIDGVTGHEWVRVQIDIYDTYYERCVQLSHDVVGLINSNIPSSLYGGTQQLYENEAKLFRQSIDYEMWQTTPTTL